eukprot:m.216163 g.216163  ORF g.216163 m.216163 type:complete len:571 (+) comp25637_c0_seq1:176-1888(+)
MAAGDFMTAAFLVGAVVACSAAHGPPPTLSTDPPPLSGCGIAEIDASALNPTELRAAFAAHHHLSPVIIRGVVSPASLVTLDALRALRSTVAVQVGTPGDIVGNAGQGTTSVTLSEYLNQFDPDAARGTSTSSSNSSGTEIPLYAFDRGQLWGSLESDDRERLLGAFPTDLFPPLNRTLPSVAGFTLEAAGESGGAGHDAEPRGQVPAGYDVYFALGGNGTGVPFHYHAETMMVLHDGMKRWFTFPPATRPVPRHHNPTGLAGGWTPRSPRHYSDTVSVCDQRAGDAVYLPSGWHHGTVNFGASTFGMALQARVPLDPLGRGRQLANGLATTQRHADAVEVLRILIAQWPTDSELRYVLGTSLRSLADAARGGTSTGHHDARALVRRSRFSLGKALDLDPDDDRAALALCRGALQELEDGEVVGRDAARVAEDAARGCGQAPTLNPFAFAAWFYHGRYQAAAQDLDSAAESFRRATALNQRAEQAWYHLANTLMQGAATPAPEATLLEAAAAFARVIQLQPDFAQPRLEFGILLQRMGRPKQARAQLEKAAELSPELAQAAHRLLGRTDL